MPFTLLGDVGGTTSRFALAGAGGAPEQVRAIAGDSVSSCEAAIARYLDETGARPYSAVLAVAGPVDGEVIRLTNRDWRFRLGELAHRFGFARIRAINDFEAVAWSLLAISPEHGGKPLGLAAQGQRGVKVAFGPGTGLGVAALAPIGDGWQVIATEGGHVSFGPAAADEEPIFARLREKVGAVSAEMVLSGPGIERLHQALHPGAAALSASQTVACAEQDDAAALATVAFFVRLLGRFAGDLALLFKATGGVYVAGGVAKRLGPLLDARIFRAAFEAHPPFKKLLAAIPTILITLEEPGLVGCGVVAQRMLREEV